MLGRNSYFVIFIGEMLQECSCVALDRVQSVVEHGDDFWQLWLSPASGGTLSESAVQRSHAASFTLGQRGSASPVVHVRWTAHVAIQGSLITPVNVQVKYMLISYQTQRALQ